LRPVILIGALLLIVQQSACSSRNWYEGIQKNNELNCYKLAIPEQMDCLEQARSISYDEYQRELDKFRGRQ
jgi:hypothetical protein